MERKLNLTKQILATLDKPFAEEIALATWWTNIQDTGGMGLTEHGYNLFTQQLDIKSYEWDIVDKLYGNKIKSLDNNIERLHYTVKGQAHKIYFHRKVEYLNLVDEREKFDK